MPSPLPDPFVVDELLLRPPTEADVPAIAALCQDEAIREFTTVPSPYTEDDARWWVDLASRTIAQGRGAHLLVAVDGEPAAAVGIGIDERDRDGVVGYWTGPDHRGRGIATRATRAICRWAIEAFELEHVTLDAAATNVGSNAVAERLGFRLEGTQRRAMRLGVSGTQVDRNLWGLLPGELR